MTKSRNILKPRAVWTDDMLALMRVRYPNERTAVIAADLCLAANQVYAQASRMGLKKSELFHASSQSGRLGHGQGASTRFQKGHQTWNKGTHFTAGGRSAETRFKRGHKLNEEAPLGALRISKDGYLERKTSMTINPPTRRWVGVHRLVWIAAHGPILPKHVIAFKKGMRTNVEEEITLDRIEMISMVENSRRNSYHNNYPKEVAQLIQLRGAIKRKINRRLKDEQPTTEE